MENSAQWEEKSLRPPWLSGKTITENDSWSNHADSCCSWLIGKCFYSSFLLFFFFWRGVDLVGLEGAGVASHWQPTFPCALCPQMRSGEMAANIARELAEHTRNHLYAGDIAYSVSAMVQLVNLLDVQLRNLTPGGKDSAARSLNKVRAARHVRRAFSWAWQHCGSHARGLGRRRQ